MIHYLSPPELTTATAWARNIAGTLEARVADRQLLDLTEMADLAKALRMLCQGAAVAERMDAPRIKTIGRPRLRLVEDMI